MLFVLSRSKHRRVELNGVVAGDPSQDAEHRRLTVGASAVAKDHELCGDVAGERVAGEALDEGRQIAVAFEDFLEESAPDRCIARGFVLDGHELRVEFVGIMRAQLASPEVDDPIEAIQSPGIGVELAHPDGDAALGSSQLEDAADLRRRLEP